MKIDFQEVKQQIAQGRVESVLMRLVAFIEGVYSNMTTEIYLTSARYRRLEAERLRGAISSQDYNLTLPKFTLHEKWQKN